MAPHLIAPMWPHAVTLIERALLASKSDFTPAYMRKRLDAGKALLWIVWDGKQVLAVATTEIQLVEHQRRALIITACAGRNIHAWKRYLHELERYARREHCVLVRSYGRRGWSRFLRAFGYTEPWGVVEKVMA